MSRNRLLAAILLLASLACNMPRLVIPDPTRTPAPTLPPTRTAPPPTPSPTFPPLPAIIPPAPTTAAPAVEGPPPAAASSATPAPLMTALLTAVAVTEPPPPTLAPTASFPTPRERTLFEGTFTGGKLSLRIGANSLTIIPKSLILKSAACKEGGKTSTAISFDPPPEYRIDRGRFTIGYDNMVTIYGQFQSAERILGNVTVKLALSGGVCTVGPLPYAATVSP